MIAILIFCTFFATDCVISSHLPRFSNCIRNLRGGCLTIYLHTLLGCDLQCLLHLYPLIPFVFQAIIEHELVLPSLLRIFQLSFLFSCSRQDLHQWGRLQDLIHIGSFIVSFYFLQTGYFSFHLFYVRILIFFWCKFQEGQVIHVFFLFHFQ